jgi:acyl carrier protein
MSDTRRRLLECFSVIFPSLSLEQIENATPATVADWDSVASVTLISVIEEEFAVQIELDHFERLLSFAGALQYLEGLQMSTST